MPHCHSKSPLILGNPYLVNRKCSLVFGNTPLFAEFKWRLSQCASPLCMCGPAEENSTQYFYCHLRDQYRAQNIGELILLIYDDCQSLSKLIKATGKVNKQITQRLSFYLFNQPPEKKLANELTSWRKQGSFLDFI